MERYEIEVETFGPQTFNVYMILPDGRVLTQQVVGEFRLDAMAQACRWDGKFHVPGRAGVMALAEDE